MGGKTATTTQQVKIPPEVLARYNAVNARAEGVASNPFQIYSNDPSAFVAQLTPQQMAGMGAVNEASNAYRPYMDQAALTFSEGLKSAQPGDLTIDKFMNPYQQNVIDATMRQMTQANEQAQSGALGTAVSSGAFGGDRAGIAAANLANQQGLSMGSTLAGLNAQNYNQALQTAQQQQGMYLGATQADLERLMQGGQFYAGLGQAAQSMGLQGAEAMINAGTLGQQTEQAGLTALYNQFQQQLAYPFQVAQFLGNIAMGTGALSGSTTTTTQPAPFFSDRRLKEDIRRIGHTDDGLPIYKFKYKGDEGQQTHIGFMADEVEQVKPEAVGVSGGYKTVDYDRATKAGGGGVAGPYSMRVGSDSPYVSSYVPQAYLPVGELMIADPAILQNAEQGMAQNLAAAANFGENIVKLRDTFGKDGSIYRREAQRSAEAAANTKSEPSIHTDDDPRRWRGGVAGYASGGPAYLQEGIAAAKNPVGGDTYLTDTLASQEADKDKSGLDAPSMPGQQQSTLGQIGSAAGSLASIAKLGTMLLSLSDRRAKEGIRRIGRTDHGMPIYSFKYKDDDREQTHIGFMADEVEKEHPDAVMTGTDGYKRVDHGQAHKFYRGGGVRPAFQAGGTETEEERLRRLREALSGQPGARTDAIPSGVIPQPDRISSPVTYDLAPFDWKTITTTTGVAPGLYEYDAGTGMVRDPQTKQYISDTRTAGRNQMTGLEVVEGGELSSARNQIANQQQLDLARLEAEASRSQEFLDAATKAAREAGSYQSPNVQFPDIYRKAEETRAAADAYAAEPGINRGPYVSPAEEAIRLGGAGLRQAGASDVRDRLENSYLTGVSPAADPTVPGGAAPAIAPPTMGDRLAANEPLHYERMLISSSPRPQSRPEGLGAAAAADEVVGDTTVKGDVRRDGTTYDMPGAKDFYRTRIIKQESGGRQFDADGNPLTSPKGAIGVGQIMPATGPEAAALAGLEWDEDRFRTDPEYNAALGEAYFLEQYRRFGSLDLAAAAYNAGPGALRSAIDRAASLGGSYLDYLPKETQNYVRATTGASTTGVGAEVEPERRGLAAGILNPEKPYEERNTLGKMFYNEDGSVNKNALLSILSGVGTMASSPSRYLGSAILQGVGGAANTYAGLEKLQADIGLTKAQERQARVAADTGRIYESAQGVLLINLGDGRPPVELWKYLENPSRYSTGDPQLDAQIMREAQATAQENPKGEGVFATPEVASFISREALGAERRPNEAVAQSAAIESAVGAAASSARSAIPSVLTQADAVAAITSPDAAVRAGALGGFKQQVANYLNDISATLSQMTGQQLPTITDPNGGDAASNAQIILKEATAAGMVNASGIQELQAIMSAQPNVGLTAEANSALMAGLMVAGRRDLRLSEFMRDYKVQDGNTYRTVLDAGQAFQQLYGEQINAEKAALKNLMHYGSMPMPEEWKAVVGDYSTPMEFLMTPGIPVEVKNEFIMKLLPEMGVNALTIEALNGPSGSYIGNYFGG